MDNTNKFATAAMILGICSLIFLCTFFLPLPLGALGILFVILSHRRGRSFSTPAVTGLITSLISVICSAMVLIMTFFSGILMLKPENRESLNHLYEQQYGISFDEYLDSLEEQFGSNDFLDYFK